MLLSPSVQVLEKGLTKLNPLLQPEKTGSEGGYVVKKPPFWKKLWLQCLPLSPQLEVRQVSTLQVAE